MRLGIFFISGVLSVFLITSCMQAKDKNDTNIIFLHHSTGEVIMNGNTDLKNDAITLPGLFKSYNKKHNKKYSFKETDFPKSEPYGWKNYPYDYYNIWVKNAGNQPFLTEPTLEMLTKDYDVIVFKHCFPVSNIQPDESSPDIDSELRSIANYKLQYEALREKLHEFSDVKFIVFTGAVQVKANITEEEALRAKSFFTWVKENWDQPDDNIYLWDLYELQTEGGIYFKDEYARKATNSHPNREFAGRSVKLLFNRIIDVIEKNGTGTSLTGEMN